MTPEQSRELRRLAKSHRIFFVPNPAPPETWPEQHRDTFLNIRKIGEFRHDSYGETVDIHTGTRPWRNETKRRASRLSGLAALCQRERRNEAGWRMLIEPEVFARFTVEVACPQCRARLWRSEIEAPVPPSVNNVSSLAERRRNRISCVCHPKSRPGDSFDTGLNPIFSDRAEELVIHSELLQADLTKKERPDRIYGLQQTRNFETALDAPCSSVDGTLRSVRDVIDHSPFPDDGGHPLIFPFMIAEAKSEKAADSSSSIETQTMFPIKTLLTLQECLQRQSARDEVGQAGPLVWFVSYKGQDWRIYGCYVDSTEVPAYKILHLWSGCITFLDHALQLLLIMDYVFDWARDIYRPSILRHLRLLSSENAVDTATIGDDSDIFSLKGQIPSWIPDPNVVEDESVDIEEMEEFKDVKKERYVLRMDPKTGLVRQLKGPEYHLRGVYITADNARTFLESDTTALKSRRSARAILSSLSYAGLVLSGEDVLTAIEDRWTGNLRSIVRSPASTNVFACITVSCYINADWDLIQELNYIAVSEGGLEVLFDCLQLKEGVRRFTAARSKAPLTSDNEIELLGFLGDIRNSSLGESLLAGVHRTVLRLNRECSSPVSTESGLSFSIVEPTSSSKKLPSLCELVDSIYQKNQIGRREPTGPFLHHSRRTHDEPLPDDQRSSHTLKSILAEPNLFGADRNSILVYGDYNIQDVCRTLKPPKLCLFILGNQGDFNDVRDDVAAMLEKHLTDEKMYFTLLDGKQRSSQVIKLDGSPLEPGLVSSNEELNGIVAHASSTLKRQLLTWVTLLFSEKGNSHGSGSSAKRVIEAVPELNLMGMWIEEAIS